MVLKDIERHTNHLTKSVQDIVENVKEVEAEDEEQLYDCQSQHFIERSSTEDGGQSYTIFSHSTYASMHFYPFIPFLTYGTI